MKVKRMIIALVIAALFGIYCSYATNEYLKTAEIPGLEVSIEYLLTIFYSRLLLGFVIGFVEDVKLIRQRLLNSIIRGTIMGAIVSLGISFYGFTGAYIFIIYGIIYGAIIDLAATKFGS
ncbi:MAG: hypothetical protein NWE86_08195 [Candidatus Bathyarchaeota archaeon]|nr:hypothetical protein [Candidatus Bathyarchaeota archaeon]